MTIATDAVFEVKMGSLAGGPFLFVILLHLESLYVI